MVGKKVEANIGLKKGGWAQAFALVGVVFILVAGMAVYEYQQKEQVTFESCHLIEVCENYDAYEVRSVCVSDELKETCRYAEDWSLKKKK